MFPVLRILREVIPVTRTTRSAAPLPVARLSASALVRSPGGAALRADAEVERAKKVLRSARLLFDDWDAEVVAATELLRQANARREALRS
jgi:hypothetical protein